MFFGYARISTATQEINLQIEALEHAGCKKIFKEMALEKKDQKILSKILKIIHSKDTLIVWRLDCLNRSSKSLIDFMNELKTKEIHFKSIVEGIDTSDNKGEFFFHITKVLSEMENNLIHEKRMYGLSLSRERGIKGGRPRVID
ncbi:MAG: recombinase family protein [Oligoflexia bacterium]|nr:recombinase family protein [Oligoflexia bacterium]